MITQVEEHEIVRGNIEDEHIFKVKASAKAFNILSSGLYSDKILAVVRELSCNAYDAHKAAGNEHTPIEIKLPTMLDPTFYVKDFGTGLSHEQICSLYTTYFESTKGDSNDFIGALGLGSKSPFSYVSTFFVESRHEGMKRIYSCFINETGIPSITQMAETPSDEPNGLTITLSAKKDDCAKFYVAARKALMYFTPIPHVIGYDNFEPFKYTYTVEGSNWKIRTNEHSASMNGPYVVQGFVAYPIDGPLLISHGLSKVAKTVAGIGIDFTVNIGDVDVAASREALSYDTNTIKNLVDIFERAALELRDSFQNSISKCETQWQVASMVYQIQSSTSYEFRTAFSNMNEEQPFTWKGQPVARSVKAHLPDIFGTNITCYKFWGRRRTFKRYNRWSCSAIDPLFTLEASPAMHVITDTVSTGNNEAYSEYLRSLPHLHGHYDNDNILVVISPRNKGSYNQREIDTVVERLGSPEFKTAASLGIIKQKKSSQAIKRAKEDRLVWDGFMTENNYKETIRRTFSKFCWIHEPVDISEGGFYIPVERFTVVDGFGGRALTQIDTILKCAAALKFVDTDKVYGFRETDIKQLPKGHTWINLLEHVKTEYNNSNVNGKLTSRRVFDYVCTTIGSDFKSMIVQRWDKLQHDAIDGDFKEFVSMLQTLDTNSHIANQKLMEDLRTSLGIEDDVSKRVEELETAWMDMLKSKYEMLLDYNMDTISVAATGRIIRYVNQMEKISLTSQE